MVGGDSFFLSRQSLIACSSFRVGALWEFFLFTLACQLVLSLWRSIFGGILLRFHECSFPGVDRRNFLTADVNSMFVRKFWPCQQIFLFEYSRNGILAFSTYKYKGSQSLHNIQFNRQLYLLRYFFQLCPIPYTKSTFSRVYQQQQNWRRQPEVFNVEDWLWECKP